MLPHIILVLNGRVSFTVGGRGNVNGNVTGAMLTAAVQGIRGRISSELTTAQVVLALCG